MTDASRAGHIIDRSGLPSQFPTHRHTAAFWESLGRAVGTFGFLEEVLGKAIFAFTATRRLEAAAAQGAYLAWLPTLERALSDPLGKLIPAYSKAVREHNDTGSFNVDDLVCELRKAAEMRNILCHSSWMIPDAAGASMPFFVDRQGRVVDTAFDASALEQVQRHVASLACAVMDSFTSIGWQFPGSDGPGEEVWKAERTSQ